MTEPRFKYPDTSYPVFYEDLTNVGTKHDSDKPRMDLLDPDFLVDVARVMGFGAQKYDAHNWRKGLSQSRLYAALQRHLNAYWSGEESDEETGLSHLAHAGCCLMFLHWTSANIPEMDDRWPGHKP